MKEEAGWKERLSKRFHVDFTAYFNDGRERVDGVITQISEGGAIFVTGAKLAIRTPGILHIDVFSGESAVVINGEIIYALQSANKDAGRYGIRFSCADKEMKETLARVFMFVSVRERYQSRHGNNGPGGSNEIR
ncbi:MAG: PilZ domain-containing protein [Deltaproteobacteria bacterium]|nr:PilZ domain-containing protein [Deltaproteobacteria bacterium]